MQHVMNLDNKYFIDSAKNLKKVEFRLNDAKRQKIKPGDTIKFINRDNPNLHLNVKVTNLIYGNTFSDLITNIDNSLINYEADVLSNILNKIYSIDDINFFGVVAIQFEVI